MQRVLISAQVVALLLFAIVAVVKVAGDDATAESVSPAVAWFSPFDLDREALVAGLLTGVFIYWGWESAVSLTEETKNSITAPGTAAVVSTVILLVTYVGVAVAVVGFAGPAALEAFADDDSVLATVAGDVLGTPWDKIVVLAVLSSALASTQTTILPASRTVLSMARADALPTALGQVDQRFRTPVVATVAIGVLATIWYLPAKLISSNFLYDSLTALALLIAFYYALSGLACAVYYRHELRRSVRHAVTIGVAPVVGALLLGYLLVEAVRAQSDPANSYAGTAWLGVGPPLVIGSAALLLGLVVMVGRRLAGHPQFFGRRPFEAVPPDIARDGATVESDEPVLPVAR
jgi:amino acid transporter